jgi:hypothetical protein
LIRAIMETLCIKSYYHPAERFAFTDLRLKISST